MSCGLNTLGCTNNAGNIPPATATPCPGVLVSCAANQTTWTPISVGSIITDDHINEIRTALDAEYTRRNYVRLNASRLPGWDSNTNNVTTNSGTYTNVPLVSGDTIIHTDVEELYTQIAVMKIMVWNTNVKFPLTDVKITAQQVLELREKTNDCEKDCLCNCDYCTCNCNYCTCNCNYCPCNCNFCACDCNYYGCPCYCNYCGGHSPCPCNGRSCRPLGGW